MRADGSSTGTPRRTEVLAGLSVAIDLGLGQPAEHMLRSAVIGCRLAERLGMTDEQRGTVYYATLLMWIGCHADSQEYARWFGDDIAVRADSYLVDWAGLPYLRFLIGNVARGESVGRRARVLAELLADARGNVRALVHSHCASAGALARHLGLGADVQGALAFAFERYDGGGLPDGRRGDELPMATRIAQLADLLEVHHRLYGLDGALAMACSRRGGQFDPAVVDAFAADPGAVLAEAEGDTWRAAMALAPDRDEPVAGAELDEMLAALGDFADLKCPFMLGHSRAVAELAESAGAVAGRSAAELARLRRAGHLHDLGRLGVSNHVWSRPGALSSSDWERMRMHPYLSGRVLSHIPGLAAEAALVRTHHEQPDGNGYPLGLTGQQLGPLDGLLAASAAYRAALEPRPYREALSPGEAADRLRQRVRAGRLDGDAAAAVLTAAGERQPRSARLADLTPREAEVLGLVARGLSNRQIAARLYVSEKTVRNHVERAYAKIGVANRVGASLFALEHGLAGAGA
jgi:HD-GYP domain-containing protein (c-di-GMP phosphodiesterase class II)